jgi:hypothetical protein
LLANPLYTGAGGAALGAGAGALGGGMRGALRGAATGAGAGLGLHYGGDLGERYIGGPYGRYLGMGAGALGGGLAGRMASGLLPGGDDEEEDDPRARRLRKRSFVEELAEKSAVLAWGGGQYHLGNPEKFPVGLEAGYSNMMGLVPFPTVGARVGGPHFGMSAGGPLPYMGVDTGVSPGLSRNYPRGVMEWLYDKAKGNKSPREEYEAALREEEEQGSKKRRSMKKRSFVEALADRAVAALAGGN